MRVFTGQFIDRAASIEVLLPQGMIEVPTGTNDRWHVLIPESFVSGSRGRIAIIDDTTTTGGSLEAIRRYLLEKGYRPEDIRTGCFVCYEGVKARPDHPVDFAYIYSSKRDYLLPWGTSPW
jgi:hypoxanthine phosphoribosyltransferase